MLKRLNSLRVRILAIAALCWLLPTLILGAYMGGVFSQAFREKTAAFLESGAGNAQKLATQELERVIGLSKEATYGSVFESTYSAYNRGQMRYAYYYNSCRTYLNQHYSRERTVAFAAYFSFDDTQRLIYTLGGEEAVEVFRLTALEHALSLSEEMDTRCRVIAVDGNAYLLRNLYDRKLEPFGMLVFGLRTEALFSMLYEVQPLLGTLDYAVDEYVYLGEDATAFDLANPTIGLADEGDYLVFTQQTKTEDYALTTRYRANKHIVFAQVEQYALLMRVLLVSLVPVGVVIVLFAHRRLSRPLKKLADASERMEQGELGVTVPMQGNDEIGQAGRAFNAMSVKIQELVDKSLREEIVLRDARIEALQSRINPHFLNNALEIINWQARMEGSEQIGAMVESLSVLLNAALDRGGERLVPLREEIAIAEAYFHFLAQRFGQRLTVRREIDAALLEVPVPRLVIQTLLENAVEHGIAPVGGGSIRLSVYRRYEFVYIDIVNDGKRLTNENSARIAALLSKQERDYHSEHLGIRNVQDRLELLYGGAASLSIRADEHGDTCARIIVPL